MEKKRNKDGEMEMFSIEFTNSRGEKEDGLVIEYYDEKKERKFGDLGCSTTVLFISPKIVSEKGAVNPKMQKKIVAFVSEFLGNYIEGFVEELAEELKKPIKKEE